MAVGDLESQAVLGSWVGPGSLDHGDGGGRGDGMQAWLEE